MPRQPPLVTPADAVAALGLLTRLPLPERLVIAGAARGAAAAWAYPLAGAVVGAMAAGVLILGHGLGLGAGPAAGLALAVAVIVTGGLHEDGLADTADGLWGGRDAARRLAIMTDSRIGSYGVLALVLSLILRWSCLTVLADTGMAATLVAVGAASRAALLLPFGLLPPVRPGGLAARTGRPGRATIALGGAVAAVICLALLGPGGLAILGAAGLAGLAAMAIARAKIGGQTGDILGATQQLAEIAALLTLAALV